MPNKPLGWAVSALLIVVLSVSGCGSEEVKEVQPQPQTVKVITVSSSSVEPIRQFPGRVAASETANVASKVAGQVTSINVQPGDEVKKGQVLLQIDETDYQLNLEQAQANYDLAKVSYDRVESSRKRNISTQADLDNAKANFDKASVGLKQARNQLNDTRIRAPFAGTVVKVSPKQFDFIGSAQPLVYLHSRDDIDIKFQVPSDVVAQMDDDTEEARTQIIFDAFPDQVFDAKFKEFSADSDRSTRGFDVTFTLKTPPQDLGTLLPGMDATVLVDLSILNLDETITIPSHSVFERQGASYVWAVDGNQVQKRQVQLGEFRETGVVVIEGLDVGDVVVAAGIQKLTDGQSISVWSEK